jgi:hypothetical protein
MRNGDNNNHRIFVLIILISLFTIISGCMDILTAKTADISTDIEIDENGNISSYDSTIQMSDNTYQIIKNHAESQGYSSVRELFLRDFKGGGEFFEYNEKQTKDGKTIYFENVGSVDSKHTIKSITLTKDGRSLIFNDTTFLTDYFIPRSYISNLEYSVTVPGTIKYTNSNSKSKVGIFDKETATWKMKGDEKIPALYLNSEMPVQQTIIVPGFGSLISIFGICLGLFFFPKKK